jgi:isoquinoline 1-oxidoreductase beta subunit
MKDKTTLEGLFDLPYALTDRKSEHMLMREPVPVGFWRSVGHSHNAFFAECFMDECAHAAGRDPFEFRRDLLSEAPRHKAVLEAAAARAGWGGALPEGRGRGIALAESFHSIVAQVAEVEVRDGQLAVRRIVCVVDCGFAVNPDAVAAQMEGGIVFGLTAALGGAITLKDGRVEQGNFGDYPLLRLVDTPEIEVHILESGIEHLGGVGEPGTPPVAPAVCNAIHAATGRRIRSLPIAL